MSRRNPKINSVATPAGPSRRHFLRGLGVCIALPAFESFVRPALGADTAAGSVAATATGAPVRTAFVYFPNGAIPAGWWPTGEEASFKLAKTMAPLEDMRAKFSVLRGLDHKWADGRLDGAGDHARANSVFLTGVRIKKSASDIQAGVSIDQVLAKEIGHLTRFPSLELSCDYNRKAGACDSGYSCAYQYNISWSSPKTPMTPESNPRLVFERLFGAGSRGERSENFRRRQAEERSVLDYVLEDARGMESRLGTADNRKLDQYLTGLRDIESRIERAEKFGKTADPDMETPAGIPTSYEEHVQLMYNMLVLSFQTDSTRIATLLLAHDGSNRSFADIGISEGHHDLSHHQNRQSWIDKVAAIDLWYAKQFSKFIAKLDSVKDVDGNSLLHNSQIVYGGGNSDGNRHTHTNLPIILAGNAGGATTPGRYINFKSKPATNLFLTMADRIGLTNLERFGDSTGRLSQL